VAHSASKIDQVQLKLCRMPYGVQCALGEGLCMQLRTSVVCPFVSALAAFGQSDRGAITGSVSDPAGAAVANAKLEVKNQDNGSLYDGGTSITGNYVVQLPTGNYQLTVTVSGFKKYVQQNIFVPVAQTVRLDVALQVGSVTDAVTVTEAAPLGAARRFKTPASTACPFRSSVRAVPMSSRTRLESISTTH
jgi:hypothetical protein